MCIKLLYQLGFDVLTLPPNLTGDLQPMDLSVNKALKDRYHAKWEEWFDKEGSSQLTAKSKAFSSPSKETFILWIGRILKDISNEQTIVKNGFKIYDPKTPCKLIILQSFTKLSRYL